MGLFIEEMERAEILIAHNFKFDSKVIGSELVRLKKQRGIDLLFGSEIRKNYCTMMQSKELLQLPS